MIDNSSSTNNERKLILVAEDDDISFALLEILLSREGKKLIRANTGKEAVEIFRENKNISLILMDLKMPIMDGFDATREIRKINKNVPIIAQTAYALSGDDKKALNAGCDDYITKPIKKEYLLQKVNWYLNHNLLKR